MMKEKKSLLKKLLGKSFFIELDDALTHPSTEIICMAIEAYAAESKEKLEFKSKVKPITFYLENTLYQVDIRMARGGYYISCSEV
ncbi:MULTISPECIES: DUF4318 domain-containing protein [Bacillus cereus group]|uniref:DUF4318 domain-containing protein n=1 Tax=Bacillus cereus TaxID=1396 RepID=A0AA44TDD8_BACCE|nr:MULTISPECIES: DUF4318 domain-containing protein [Bacillus cereus group]PFA13223.1 hypothetical protein CN373_24465 [Bacillus cereus]PFN06071.1 hypothetical protein COJ55_16100 [Bacillus cereus]PFO84170.1 hypothetical protein COJ77_04990 [Bacillus cereus]PFR21355.1 hypothetical protein COK19_21910 [Bacillus cereus]PFR98660.1 hypothetical protein COK38_18655 [Bacillus cereus]